MFPVSIAAESLGVCSKTLRRWDQQGRISCCRTPGGHRRISASEIERILEGRKIEKDPHPWPREEHPAIYARVSGHAQKTGGDLKRQINELEAVCKREYGVPPVEFSDVGSGLNLRRRGLNAMLQAARHGGLPGSLSHTRTDWQDSEWN